MPGKGDILEEVKLRFIDIQTLVLSVVKKYNLQNTVLELKPKKIAILGVYKQQRLEFSKMKRI